MVARARCLATPGLAYPGLQGIRSRLTQHPLSLQLCRKVSSDISSQRSQPPGALTKQIFFFLVERHFDLSKLIKALHPNDNVSHRTLTADNFDRILNTALKSSHPSEAYLVHDPTIIIQSRVFDLLPSFHVKIIYFDVPPKGETSSTPPLPLEHKAFLPHSLESAGVTPNALTPPPPTSSLTSDMSRHQLLTSSLSFHQLAESIADKRITLTSIDDGESALQMLVRIVTDHPGSPFLRFSVSSSPFFPFALAFLIDFPSD